MVYTVVDLKISEDQGKRLSKGMAIRIQKAHIGPSHKVWVTGSQAKKIAGVAAGHHGYCLLRLGAPALKKTVQQHGGSFFSKLGDTLKDTFTKPSGILGVLSMLPTPLSMPLKVAAAATKFSGNGVMSIQAHHRAVEESLRNMGFGPKHVEYMKGHGLFSNLWSGVRKLASFLKPYVKDRGMRLLREHGPGLAASAASAAVKHFVGGGVKYHVKFTAPQLRHIKEQSHGGGIFSSLLGSIGLGVAKKRKAPAKKRGGNIFSMKPLTSNPPPFYNMKGLGKGGNLLTLGSLH